MLASKLELLAGEGEASGAVSFSIVERLLAPKVDIPSAMLSLAIKGEGFHNLSVANVRVYDHDTDELLLRWSGEEIEPNYFDYYVQEFDFMDRIGHAIRFDFDVAGATTQMSSRLTAAVFLNVPEPNGVALAIPSLVIAGSLRRRRRA